MWLCGHTKGIEKRHWADLNSKEGIQSEAVTAAQSPEGRGRAGWWQGAKLWHLSKGLGFCKRQTGITGT